MRWWAAAAVGVLLLALCVTSVGWWLDADSDDSARFDGCQLEDGVLTLTYLYGAADQPEVTVRQLDDRVVVRLDPHRRSGTWTSEGYQGTYTQTLRAARPTVTYPDGERLECQGVS